VRTAVFKSANALVGFLLQQAADRLDATYPNFADSTLGEVFSLTQSIKLLGNLVSGPFKVAVVQTYPVPNAKTLCIINHHYVFALQHAKEKWQRTPLLEHR